MIAATFYLDPIEVLKSDYFDWRVRLEAANYYNDYMRKEQEKAEQSAKKK